MTSSFFDKYSLQARLLPSLLALFPALMTIAVAAPVVYAVGVSLVGLAVACGVTVALAHVARSRGRRIEDKLVATWGGLPTTLWLRKHDGHLDATTKERYYRFLEKQVPSWVAPPQEGSRNQEDVDAAHGSAVRWLREHTRDTIRYPMVFKENISYGFRRNALGLKPIGIAISLTSGAVCGAVIWGKWPAPMAAGVLSEFGALVVSVAFLLWWSFGVTSSWVRDAADAYARALLAVCDEPPCS